MKTLLIIRLFLTNEAYKIARFVSRSISWTALILVFPVIAPVYYKGNEKAYFNYVQPIGKMEYWIECKVFQFCNFLAGSRKSLLAGKAKYSIA